MHFFIQTKANINNNLAYIVVNISYHSMKNLDFSNIESNYEWTNEYSYFFNFKVIATLFLVNCEDPVAEAEEAEAGEETDVSFILHR